MRQTNLVLRRFLMAFLSGLTFLSCSDVYAEAEVEDASELPGNQLPEQGMRVIITGAGVPAMINAEGGSSVAVLVDGDVLQFDMGPLVVERLVKAGIGPQGVDHLFLTHLHIDHVADFPEYASMQYVFGNTIDVVGPAGTHAFVDGTKVFMASHLASYEKVTGRSIKFNVRELTEDGVVFETDGYTVTAVRTPHMKKVGPHSFAYRVDSVCGSVVISGDTAPSSSVVALATGTDLLIHEASLIEPSIAPAGFYDRYLRDGKSLETLEQDVSEGQVVTGHSTPTEVGKVAQSANAGKLVVYHTLPTAETIDERALAKRVWAMDPALSDPNVRQATVDAIKENYDGPIIMAKPLMTFDLECTK